MFAYNFCLFASLLLLAKPPSSTLSQKSFDLVTSSDGLVLCAVDKPSAVFAVDSADVNSVCVPPSVRCAHSCALQHNCTAFNYRQDLAFCQLYNYAPTICTYQQWCTFFQVSLGILPTLPLRTDHMQLPTLVHILPGKSWHSANFTTTHRPYAATNSGAHSSR